MPLPYEDGTFSTWFFDGPPLVEYNVPGENGHFLVRQRMVGLISAYTGPDITSNTHPSFGSAYCIGDSPVEDLGGGVGGVMRTWCNCPSSTNTYQDYTYQYIGADPWRDPFPWTVRARVQREYFFNSVPNVTTRYRYYLTDYTYADVQYITDDASTVPSIADYTANIGTGELLAEDSSVRRFMGNWWVRESIYVPYK